MRTDLLENLYCKGECEMMTNEEYQKNLVRMYDSLRTEHKGAKNCMGVSCDNCPFKGKVCNTCEKYFRVYEAIEIVEQWVKEHPIVTNADKFYEMFGIDPPPIRSCINFKECEDCEYYDGIECDADNRFWDAEYKGQTDGCEE